MSSARSSTELGSHMRPSIDHPQTTYNAERADRTDQPEPHGLAALVARHASIVTRIVGQLTIVARQPNVTVIHVDRRAVRHGSDAGTVSADLMQGRPDALEAAMLLELLVGFRVLHQKVRDGAATFGRERFVIHEDPTLLHCDFVALLSHDAPDDDLATVCSFARGLWT